MKPKKPRNLYFWIWGLMALIGYALAFAYFAFYIVPGEAMVAGIAMVLIAVLLLFYGSWQRANAVPSPVKDRTPALWLAALPATAMVTYWLVLIVQPWWVRSQGLPVKAVVVSFVQYGPSKTHESGDFARLVYQVDGREYEGELENNGLAVGDSIRLRYLPSHPATHIITWK